MALKTLRFAPYGSLLFHSWILILPLVSEFCQIDQDKRIMVHAIIW